MAPPVSALVSLSSLALCLCSLALLGVVWFQTRAARAADRRRIDALTERVARLETQGLAPTGLGATSQATEHPSPLRIPRRPTLRRPVLRVDRPAAQEPAGPTLISVPNLSASDEPEVSDEASAALGRRFAAVWEMADSGAAPEAIARETGHPIGQVELILGLRRRIPAGGERPRAS